MSDKLLHDQLRECAYNFGGHIVLDGIPRISFSGWEAEALADEIERFYIPRPRYEDGEPVQFGDEYRADSGRAAKMRQFCAYAHGGFVIGKKGKRATVGNGQFVKRPAAKMLDADGVEVKVGDTVWRITDGLEVVVTGLERVGFVDQKGLCLNPKCYTHREPDSLEKLRDDIAEGLADVAIPANVWDIKRAEWCDRLTALMERGA